MSSGVDGGAASNGVECTNVVGVGLGKSMTVVNPNCLNRVCLDRIRSKHGSRHRMLVVKCSLLKRWK